MGRRSLRWFVLVALAVAGFSAATPFVTGPAKATPTAPTWYTATAFQPGAINPLRTINVYSTSAFWTAWGAIRPGDKINVHGVAFTGETVFAKRLPSWAVVNFDAATTFTGAAGSNLPAVWVHGAGHIRFNGGHVTNPNGGTGITVNDSSYIRWWSFTVHDTATTGLLVQGITKAADNLDLKGSISHWGLSPALDRAGLHGASLGDGSYGVKNSRFALYLHDGAAGSGVAAGGSKSTDGFWNNKLYLWCQNLTMRATSKVAGNCAQIWGENVTGNTFAYLEAENLQGRPYDANGVTVGQSLATDSVAYGRASKTNLSPYLSSTEASVSASAAWDPRHGTVFGDVRAPTVTTTTSTTTTAPTTTTTPTTTTAPTTTTTPSSPTWRTATAYPAPSFTPVRTIKVSTAGAFWTAWNAIRPGDRIDVHGVAFTGEATFATKLSNWAEVHFDSTTTFTGAAGANRPAAWIHDASHIRFYGGHLTNPAGGSGITIDDSSNISWWNFTIHDTANTGLFARGIRTASSHLDLKGEISRWGLDLSLDPHAEKGTGVHGANLADANYGVKNSRFALYLHDGPAGSGVEAGGSKSTDGFWGNTLYLWCQNLMMRATTQVAGNCAQIWGTNDTGNTFKYLEAENLQGRPYDANGMYSGESLSTATVAYGRSSHTNLNPNLSSTESSISAATAWDPRHGTVFDDVLPAH